MSNRTILVVEDDPDGQEVMSRMLIQAQAEVEVAGSAEDALELLEIRPYAGVIIDLALPGQDGFQLLSAIRSNADLSKLPCIAVTAFHTPEMRHQALESGFDAYFAKPVNRTLLLGALDELLSQ
jgi:CheY-like chemotaxis protein